MSGGRISISSDDELTTLPVASFSPLQVHSPLEGASRSDLREIRSMSITGTHFDTVRPPTNASEVPTIDTEYRGRTQPCAVLSNNYYARVASASTEGRRSTSQLLEGAQAFDETPDKSPYLVYLMSLVIHIA